jgi:tetratricopeptide (TPR) repeat protein
MHHPAPHRGATSAIELLVGPGVPESPLAPAAQRAFRAGLRAFARDDARGARRYWQDAARLAPHAPEVAAALGIAAARTGDADAARAALREATRLAPDALALWRLRADTALLAGANSDAFEAFLELVRRAPDDAEALGNLGALYREAGEPLMALKALNRALSLDPSSARTLSNTALAFHDLGEFAMAREAAAAAVARDPAYGNAHWNLALMDLLHADFVRGWAGHEQRESVRVLEQTTRRYGAPRWDGQPLDGTLFLWPEQGLGDQLQFVRFVPDVLDRLGPTGRLVVATPTPLVALFRAALPDTVTVLAADAEPPAFAAHAPLMSLPFVLGLAGRVRGDAVPYLHPVGVVPDALDAVLPEDGDERLRIGFVWAGQPKHLNDRNRSTTLETIAPLFDLPGVDAYSLQKGVGEDRIAPFNAQRAQEGRPGITPLGHLLGDFTHTAHAVARLDLVITVDTSIAHLAGAMGRAVWLLIPFVPDWRWQLARADSPWYPSARLFRQEARGAWGPVIARVAHAITSRTVAGRRAA